MTVTQLLFYISVMYVQKGISSYMDIKKSLKIMAILIMFLVLTSVFEVKADITSVFLLFLIFQILYPK